MSPEDTYRVLMPIDGNEQRATAQARALLEAPLDARRVTVTLLHVFDDREQAEATSVLQTTAGKTAADHLETAGLTVDARSTWGDPAEEIIAMAGELEADQVILGGRKRSPLGSLLFGSVSQAVVLDSDRPVTITGGVKE